MATQAVYEKSIQKTYTFAAEIPGNPLVMAESRLRLQGFQNAIPTPWKVPRTTKALTSSGYKTTLKAMLDADYKRQFEEEQPLGR